VARAYDAQCTPDFFGFNAQDELQYRGRLNASRMQPTPNARRELFEAMKQVAETGGGPQEQLPSMGPSGSTELSAIRNAGDKGWVPHYLAALNDAGRRGLAARRVSTMTRPSAAQSAFRADVERHARPTVRHG